MIFFIKEIEIILVIFNLLSYLDEDDFFEINHYDLIFGLDLASIFL